MSELTLDSNAPPARLRVMTISHAADLWLGELERLAYSARTIDTYRRLLAKLSDAYPLIDVDEVTATQIRRFLDEQGRRRDGARKAKRTIAQNVSILNEFLDWLASEGLLARNPVRRNGQRIISRPKLHAADEDDNVVTIDGEEVRRLLEASHGFGWPERLAVHLLAYLGPRRKALATARRADYDQARQTLTFREKGGKTIDKPVPHRLAELLDAAIAAGIYDTETYLVPGREPRVNKDGSPNLKFRRGERDDRLIWHLVRNVAAEASVTTHVHALRAAFATFYLETHPGQIESLQKLMGHKRIETTLVYLRRLRRRQAMETVRDLDWGAGSGSPQIAAGPMEANAGTEKEGFEPSKVTDALLERVRFQRAQVVPGAEVEK